MTKKDYELIAGAIYNQYSVETGQSQQGIENVARLLAYKLELDNPRFDRNKFITACGIETEILGINWKDGTSTIHTNKGIKTVPTDQVQQ